MQNYDAFSCSQCHKRDIVCHGHREHVDRKCKPCEEAGILCNKEELSVKQPSGSQNGSVIDSDESRVAALMAKWSGNGKARPQQRKGKPPVATKPHASQKISKKGARSSKAPRRLSESSV